MRILEWFRREKPRKRHRKAKQRPAPEKPSAEYPVQPAPEPQERSLELAGDLILKQRMREGRVIREVYVQPMKLEMPNMITLGGKLDTILTKLDHKPDREWFEHQYVDTLRDVLRLTQEINTSPQIAKPTGDKSRYVQKMELEAQQKLEQVAKIVTPTLILRTLEAGSLTVTDLASKVEVSRVSVWKHLKRLEQEGKVQFKQRGKFKYVSLCQTSS